MSFNSSWVNKQFHLHTNWVYCFRLSEGEFSDFLLGHFLERMLKNFDRWVTYIFTLGVVSDRLTHKINLDQS